MMIVGVIASRMMPSDLYMVDVTTPLFYLNTGMMPNKSPLDEESLGEERVSLESEIVR